MESPRTIHPDRVACFRLADDTLPGGHATDDGVGLVYRGTDLVEAVADRPGAAAYRVERGPDGAAVETRLEPRRLG